MPYHQFQFDAERHAELVAPVTVLLGQFVAFESKFGRRHEPAVAPVVGKSRPAVALIVGEFRSTIAFRQLGFVCAERIAVWRIICGWRLQLRRFGVATTAAATRLAHASVHRRVAGQHALIVRITAR